MKPTKNCLKGGRGEWSKYKRGDEFGQSTLNGSIGISQGNHFVQLICANKNVKI
jgi:hypothetical protein